jgi:hypothetical protein
MLAVKDRNRLAHIPRPAPSKTSDFAGAAFDSGFLTAVFLNLESSVLCLHLFEVPFTLGV